LKNNSDEVVFWIRFADMLAYSNILKLNVPNI